MGARPQSTRDRLPRPPHTSSHRLNKPKQLNARPQVEEGRAAGMTVHKKMAQQRTTDPPRTLVWHVLGHDGACLCPVRCCLSFSPPCWQSPFMSPSDRSDIAAEAASVTMSQGRLNQAPRHPDGLETWWPICRSRPRARVPRRRTAVDLFPSARLNCVATLMCKVKIHLFELSAMFGFICTSADRLSFQENNFLFRGCPRAPLPTHAVRRAGLNTSEFESSEGGLSNSNCGENFGSIDVWQTTVRAKIAASERCARSLK